MNKMTLEQARDWHRDLSDDLPMNGVNAGRKEAHAEMAAAIDAALKAQGEPVVQTADDRPTWEEVRDIIVRAVDWGYDEGFARANDEDASDVPIDDKCARIIAEFRKEKDRG